MQKTSPLSPSDREKKILVELGLTLSEARVYLALAQIGPSGIKQISKITGIHREHLYHTVHSLEDKCLIERKVGYAASYTAIPLSEALSMMIKYRLTLFSDLREEAERIIENFKRRTKQTPNKALKELRDEVSKFIIVPAQEVSVQRLKRALDAAQTSIDIITSRQRFSSAILEFAEAHEKALKRGVKIRIATEKHTAEKKALKSIQTLKKNPNYEIKYFHGAPQALVGIFDRKEATVTLSPTANLRGTANLWSNNPSFIVLAQNYFESKWSDSVK